LKFFLKIFWKKNEKIILKVNSDIFDYIQLQFQIKILNFLFIWNFNAKSNFKILFLYSLIKLNTILKHLNSYLVCNFTEKPILYHNNYGLWQFITNNISNCYGNVLNICIIILSVFIWILLLCKWCFHVVKKLKFIVNYFG